MCYLFFIFKEAIKRMIDSPPFITESSFEKIEKSKLPIQGLELK